MSFGSFAGVLLIFCCVSTAQPKTEVSSPPVLEITEGDGAINSIRLHRGHDPIVRVTTPTGEPIAGAGVTFLLPASGPSATFGGNEGLSLTVSTDSRGVAVGRGLRPNSIAGQFRIRVNTSWRGSPAVATLTQTNAEPVVHSGRTKTVVIIVAVAGAVAGGAVALAGHGNSNSAQPVAASAGPNGSIIGGTPTIGPPH